VASRVSDVESWQSLVRPPYRRSWRTGTPFIEQSIHSLACKTRSPFTNRLRRDRQMMRNLAIETIPWTAQHNSRPHANAR
jgi:hypothetical protein